MYPFPGLHPAPASHHVDRPEHVLLPCLLLVDGVFEVKHSRILHDEGKLLLTVDNHVAKVDVNRSDLELRKNCFGTYTNWDISNHLSFFSQISINNLVCVQHGEDGQNLNI